MTDTTPPVSADQPLSRVRALLDLRESQDVRDEDGHVVVRVSDIRAVMAHSCESNGKGQCRHCGADEPPPWPTTRETT
jgi:hypothetical protein